MLLTLMYRENIFKNHPVKSFYTLFTAISGYGHLILKAYCVPH